jgi:hypothetical protein
MLHALKAAQEFKAAEVPCRIFFHGIGVGWLTAFEARTDTFTQHYGPLRRGASRCPSPSSLTALGWLRLRHAPLWR